jgi:lipopolysaccharide assembly protein A
MKRLARFLFFLLLIFVLLAGFVFTLNNTVAVPLWVGTVLAAKPIGVWILLAFAIGGVAGLLLGLGLWRRFRSNMELRQIRIRLQQTEKELAMLKQQSNVTRTGQDAGIG